MGHKRNGFWIFRLDIQIFRNHSNNTVFLTINKYVIGRVILLLLNFNYRFD